MQLAGSRVSCVNNAVCDVTDPQYSVFYLTMDVCIICFFV